MRNFTVTVFSVQEKIPEVYQYIKFITTTNKQCIGFYSPTKNQFVQIDTGYEQPWIDYDINQILEWHYIDERKNNVKNGTII